MFGYCDTFTGPTDVRKNNYSTAAAAAAAILVAPSVVNYSTAAILVAPSVGNSGNPVWGQSMGDLASVANALPDPRRRGRASAQSYFRQCRSEAKYQNGALCTLAPHIPTQTEPPHGAVL